MDENNTVFTIFGVYFQIQSETETIAFPVDFDMAAVRGVMRPCFNESCYLHDQVDTSLDRNGVVRPSQEKIPSFRKNRIVPETVSVPKCPPRRDMLCAVSHQPDRRIPRMGYCTVAACIGRVLKQKTKKNCLLRALEYPL